VANAEILSISLQMEDVLLSGIIERSTFTILDEVEGDSRRRKVSTSRNPTVIGFNSGIYLLSFKSIFATVVE